METCNCWFKQGYLVVPSKIGGGSEAEVRGDGRTSLMELHRGRNLPLRNSVPNLNVRAPIKIGIPDSATWCAHLAGAAAAMATIREGLCAAMRCAARRERRIFIRADGAPVVVTGAEVEAGVSDDGQQREKPSEFMGSERRECERW